METEKAKSRLREIYEGYGLEERPHTEGELCFFDKSRDYLVFSVTADEIEEYASVADNLPDVRVGPTETTILAPDLFEQWVEALDPFQNRFLGMPSRERLIHFGDPEGGQPYVEIGPPTPLFKSFYREKGEDYPFFQEKLMRRMGLGRPSMTANAMFRGLVTIRVCNLTSEWDERTIKMSKEIIASCLFDLAYLKGLALEPKSEWPLSNLERRRHRPFRLIDRTMGNEFPFKETRYNETVTRFYKRAVASDDAYTSFISYYHVLEYHFVSVSDERLYRQLERVINDPAFSARRKQLDRIIMSVDEHSRESDETVMLKGVLAEYVEEADLIAFMREYEEHIGKSLYTEKARCFGYELGKMTIKSGHIFGPVSKRVKTIRNALVHSSDRFERKDRYVPGEEASKVLSLELPLLRFLAERVIIATARTAS